MPFLQVKMAGDWKRVRRDVAKIAKNGGKFKNRIVIDLMEAFIRDLKSKLPSTPEMKEYGKSFRIVKLTGAVKEADGHLAYAIVADRRAVDIASLPENRIAIYVVQKHKGEVSDLATLAIKYGPWTAEMLPGPLSSAEVKLVHRQVTEGEVLRLKERNLQVRRRLKEHFERAGMKQEVPKKLAVTKSLPDLFFLALRMEMGIGMTPVKHWRYAVGKMHARLKEMARSGKYEQYLLGKSDSGKPIGRYRARPMPLHIFKEECGAFQKYIERM